jgi:signal peptidase II
MTGRVVRDRRWLMLVIAAAVIVLDRVTKLWIVAHIKAGHSIILIPKLFRLSHVLNTGAAFSMFEGSSVMEDRTALNAYFRRARLDFGWGSRKPV